MNRPGKVPYFPFAVAGVLALILFPVVEFFERYLRLPRLGVVVVLAMVRVIPVAISQGSEFIILIPSISRKAVFSLQCWY